MPDNIQIQQDHVVTVHYVLTDSEGNELFSTHEDGPLTYLHGRGEIMPGLEEALEGHIEGDAFGVDLPPEQAFGEHQAERMVEVPLEQLGGTPKIGDVLSAQMPDGNEVFFRVAEVGDETASLDGNHPLAGQSIHLEVTVTEVRPATSEDIALREQEMPEGGAEHH